MTIDELMQGRSPGEIKVSCSYWDRDCFFKPYFKDAQGHWHGVNENNKYKFYGGISAHWVIWEPKPIEEIKSKVRKWLWASADGRFVSSHFMGIDEAISLKNSTDNSLVYSVKLDWTAQEFYL